MLEIEKEIAIAKEEATNKERARCIRACKLRVKQQQRYGNGDGAAEVAWMAEELETGQMFGIDAGDYKHDSINLVARVAYLERSLDKTNLNLRRSVEEFINYQKVVDKRIAELEARNSLSSLGL